MNILTISQLLFYNVHIGHKMKNAPLFVAWMIYGKRQNLWIINLKLTIYMLSLSVKLVNKLIIKKVLFDLLIRIRIFLNF